MLDYHGIAGLSVLGTYSTHVQRLYVTDFTPEVDARDLTHDDCDTHGIEIIVTTKKQRDEAASLNAQTALSFYDRLNWIVAGDLNFTLATNDRPLWEMARRTGVPFLRGLRLLIILVERGRLELEAARQIGRQITTRNPYLPDYVLQDFLSELNGMTNAKPVTKARFEGK